MLRSNQYLQVNSIIGDDRAVTVSVVRCLIYEVGMAIEV